jgi:hypothetical protein
MLILGLNGWPMKTVRIFRASLLFVNLIGAAPVAAQDLTASVWDEYTDRYWMINSEKVNPSRDPLGNGLLYTAEACTIMEMKNVSYDKGRIADGIKADEVKPGLFARAPTKLDQFETHDDYVGLGALAGVCGFRDVARRILAYGKGVEQPAMTPDYATYAKRFGSMADDMMRCKAISYNYNNVTPGIWNWDTWLARFPEIITHLKIAAGERPTTAELAVWGAILNRSGDLDASKNGSWLLNWLMVLTYQKSAYHSDAADYAVGEWWKKLHVRFPNGGIRETMTAYLGNGAKGNPLANFIEDFQKEAWNPDATQIDEVSSPQDLLRPLTGILTSDCGSKGPPICINYRELSPANLSKQLGLANQPNVSAIQASIKHQKEILDYQVSAAGAEQMMETTLSQVLSKLQATHAEKLRKVQDAIALKTKVISDNVDKFTPGMCLRSLCNNPFLCPPSSVPCVAVNSPEFQKLSSEFKRAFDELSAAISNAEKELQADADDIERFRHNEFERQQQVVIKKSKELDAFKERKKAEIDSLQLDLQAAQGLGVDIVKGLAPCSELLDVNSAIEPAIEIIPSPVKK